MSRKLIVRLCEACAPDNMENVEFAVSLFQGFEELLLQTLQKRLHIEEDIQHDMSEIGAELGKLAELEQRLLGTLLQKNRSVDTALLNTNDTASPNVMSQLRNSQFMSASLSDIENEAAAIIKASAVRGCDGTIVTSVSGRLVDSAGRVVLEVFPFVVRTAGGDAGVEPLVRAVCDHLYAAVHPAPCGLYVRQVLGNANVSANDVVAAARSTLCDATHTLGLQWDLHVCATCLTADVVSTADAATDETQPSCITLSPDGTLLAVGYTSGEIVFWDVPKGEVSKEFTVAQPVMQICFCPKWYVVCVATSVNRVEILDLETTLPVRGMHQGAWDGRVTANRGITTTSLCWSKDGESLYAGFSNGATIRYYWDPIEEENEENGGHPDEEFW